MVFFIGTLIAACRGHDPQPSPLGTLDARELPQWQQECSTPLVEERVCGRLPPDKCDRFFHTIQPQHAALDEHEPGSSATLKRTCASEGWGVWTDPQDRIVGFCIAPPPTMSEWTRMHQFIERHRGKAIADKIIEHVSGHDTDDSTRGWGSWLAPRMVPKPPEMIADDGCIEFELNP